MYSYDVGHNEKVADYLKNGGSGLDPKYPDRRIVSENLDIKRRIDMKFILNNILRSWGGTEGGGCTVL